MNFNYGTSKKIANPNSNGHVDIDMVCTFNRDGRIRPDYFRIALPDSSLITYKVETVLSLKENTATFEYQCEYIENNNRIRCCLVYWLSETRWTIKK